MAWHTCQNVRCNNPASTDGSHSGMYRNADGELRFEVNKPGKPPKLCPYCIDQGLNWQTVQRMGWAKDDGQDRKSQGFTPKPAPRPAPVPAPKAIDELPTDIDIEELKVILQRMTDNAQTNIKAIMTGVVVKTEDEINTALEHVRQDMSITLSESNIIRLIQSAGVQRREISFNGADIQIPPMTHVMFEDVLTVLGTGRHVFLPGPAGSGKSTLARQCAEALELRFGSISLGPTTPTTKLFGYMDAHGNYQTTEFRKCWEDGGIFLVDEMDNGHPGLLAELNQALAGKEGDYAAFADGMVKRHKDFRCVATGNTFGRGPDRMFVGRNILDAATLDRFVTIEVQVDEAMERRIALSYAPEGNEDLQGLVNRWVDHVQEIRGRVMANKMQVVVSPRATEDGAALLIAGMAWERVEDIRLFAGWTEETRSRVDY